MTEFLTIQNVSALGLLIIAVVALTKVVLKLKSETDKSQQEKVDIILMNQSDERVRHQKEEKELKVELKEAREEAKKDREIWLKSLQDNTEQLKNVANKLEIIPKLEARVEDIDNKLDSFINGGIKN